MTMSKSCKGSKNHYVSITSKSKFRKSKFKSDNLDERIDQLCEEFAEEVSQKMVDTILNKFKINR